MKGKLIAFLIGALLASTTVAGAATSKTNSQIRHAGVVCKTYTGTAGGGITCIKNTGYGYGVGITRDFVMVVDENGRRVFLRFHDQG